MRTTPVRSKESVFHGFVLGNVIGIRWTLKPTGGMGNNDLIKIVRQYLDFAYSDDEWGKNEVLQIITSTRGQNKKLFKSTFPSMFKNKRQRPLQVPAELEGQGIKFNIDFINELREQVSTIKKGLNMDSENTTVNSTESNVSNGVDVTTTRVEATTESETNTRDRSASKTQRSTNNFTLPEGVSLGELTLDNFREKTGRRFRMTKQQKARFDNNEITREDAFNEFISQLGGN